MRKAKAGERQTAKSRRQAVTAAEAARGQWASRHRGALGNRLAKQGVSIRQTPEITMRYLTAVFILLSVTPSFSFAQSHMGTPQEQAACKRDASRFCRQQLNDDSAVQQCLQQNRARLSKACQKVFASHGM